MVSPGANKHAKYYDAEPYCKKVKGTSLCILTGKLVKEIMNNISKDKIYKE